MLKNGGFPPKNGWFMMENPIFFNDYWGSPYDLGKLQMHISWSSFGDFPPGWILTWPLPDTMLSTPTLQRPNHGKTGPS
jgi:hypothetical protein